MCFFRVFLEQFPPLVSYPRVSLEVRSFCKNSYQAFFTISSMYYFMSFTNNYPQNRPKIFPIMSVEIPPGIAMTFFRNSFKIYDKLLSSSFEFCFYFYLCVFQPNACSALLSKILTRTRTCIFPTINDCSRIIFLEIHPKTQ